MEQESLKRSAAKSGVFVRTSESTVMHTVVACVATIRAATDGCRESLSCGLGSWIFSTHRDLHCHYYHCRHTTTCDEGDAGSHELARSNTRPRWG